MVALWSNWCCLKIQRPLLNSEIHISMDHRSLQPSVLPAGCSQVQPDPSLHAPRKSRRRQCSDSQPRWQKKSKIVLKRISPGHFMKRTVRRTHLQSHHCRQRHRHLSHSHAYTHTHTQSVVEWLISSQGQTWQGIPMRLSVISATSAFCSLFLEMALEPQLTEAMEQ